MRTSEYPETRRVQGLRPISPRQRIIGFQGQREVTIWCSNDYFGIGGHPKVLEAALAAVQRHGTAPALFQARIHGVVEPVAELADLHRKSAAVVFSSGWVSNLAAISTIASLFPNCLILSDTVNHHSIIEGSRRSRCEKKVWRHNDVAHLERLPIDAGGDRAKLIVFESLYSMGGDIVPVREDVELAERHNARPISTKYTRLACTAREEAASLSAKAS